MIGALLGVALQQASPLPTLLGTPDPDSSVVTIQAAIRLPSLSPREEAAVRCVVDTMLKGTEEYSSVQLRNWGSQTGVPPRVELMQGFVRVGFSVPRDQVSTGISMVESLLRRASLAEADLREWIGRRPVEDDDFWGVALWPSQSKVRDLRLTDVPDAYRRYFRPENTVIALGGAFRESDVQALKGRYEMGSATRVRPLASDFSTVRPVLKNDTAITTVEWRFPEFSLQAPDASAKLLAGFALGVGKDASAFRVLREQLRLSYRQEAVLWSVPMGFRWRLMLARSGGVLPPETMQSTMDALKADVETWTDDTLRRAKGSLRAAWVYSVGPNPLYLSPRGPLSGSLEDRTFLKAFWQLKTGAPWDPETISAQTEKVTLDELKKAASEMLTGAMNQTIVGIEAEP